MANPHTILIAEDDDNDVWFFRRACEKEKLHHQLRFVHDGEQVLDYLQGKPPFTNRKHFPLPDLLIIDLKMPRLDGFGVVKWVRNAPSLGELPVVVLTTSYLDEDKVRAEQLGARAYHVKTPDPRQMQQLIREICRKWLGDGSSAQDQ